MRETSYHAVIAEMTVRSLWETQNVMDCIPDELWQRLYGGAPLWQHLYHALHSLDQWFINPNPCKYKYFIRFLYKLRFHCLPLCYFSNNMIPNTTARIAPYFFCGPFPLTGWVCHGV